MAVVTPFLWFTDQAEQAAELYVGLIPRSSITHVQRFEQGGPFPEGTAMAVSFTLDGVAFTAFNGGPGHPFTDAFSLQASAGTQEEIDRLWDALVADGGRGVACGWLVDRFGLSWQIVPPALVALLSDPDPERAGRVTQAMLGMVKLDLAALLAAADAG